MSTGQTSGTPVGDGRDVTLGEVYRYLLSFERRTLDRFKALDDRMALQARDLLRTDVYEVRHVELRERVKELEACLDETQRRGWSTRSALLVGIISALVGSGFGAAIAALAVH